MENLREEWDKAYLLGAKTKLSFEEYRDLRLLVFEAVVAQVGEVQNARMGSVQGDAGRNAGVA